MALKRTPLYDCHIKAGAKMVAFAGYEMPVQYPTGILKEHNVVREHVGMFDCSHMGEIKVVGESARDFLNGLISSDLSQLKPGRIKYGVLCNELGFVIDDVLVYCIHDYEFMVVVNASNKEKDYQWFSDHCVGDVVVEDWCDDYALIAVQGPRAYEYIHQFTTLPEQYFSFIQTQFGEHSCLISRTGYTGEDGFEIYCKPANAPEIWNVLLEAGISPCGLGARDTLRLEAALPLYGHELTDHTTPLDAGLKRFVSFKKDAFIGQKALKERTPKQFIGFELAGRSIAREKALIYQKDQCVGTVTSGTFSPTYQKGIGMAMIDYGVPLDDLTVDIRGNQTPIKIVALPFIRK